MTCVVAMTLKDAAFNSITALHRSSNRTGDLTLPSGYIPHFLRDLRRAIHRTAVALKTFVTRDMPCQGVFEGLL